MKKLKVVATDGMAKEGAALLERSGAVEAVVLKGVPANELEAALRDADLAIIRSATNLKRDALAKLPNLKGVLRAGVGIDNIDLKAAEELGVWVWNAPTGNFQATAELALGLLFAAARKIPFATEASRHGKWAKKDIGESGRQLSGSTLGIFGAGNIGLRMAKMAQGIGMKVLVCDPVFKPSMEHAYALVDFDSLLKESDFITIHAPMLESTRHAFRAESFRKMKPSAILVNAARGGIVHDADLLAALEQNLVAGAALDVFEKEPWPENDPVYARLLKDPRVVATPHVGASTLESQRLVGIESAEKILAVAAHAAGGAAPAPRALNRPVNPRLALKF